MSDIDNARTLLDAGAGSVKPLALVADEDVPDVLAGVVPPGYQIQTRSVAAELDRLRAAPRRVTGTATVTDTASWLAYFGKHGGEHSEVFGDVTAGSVTAILNAPTGPGEPAWGDHRVVLQVQHSAAWTAWTVLNEKLLSQTAFAEHIEGRSPDFLEPDAATMLEVAQTFQSVKNVTFESSQRLRDGQTRFQYLEQVEAKAGNRGEIDVPSQFTIQIQPWRGVGIVVPITARLRSRTTRDGLALGYVLDQVDDVLDSAWEHLLAELTNTLPVPVLAGRAPEYGGR